jgi:lysophospholipase L1-like esterase
MRQATFRTLAVAGGLIAALAIGEGVARFALSGLAPEPMNVDREMVFHQKDAELGYQLRPGAKGTFQGIDVRVNSLGCRGPEPLAEGPLVVALGDSITFGAGVSEGDAFPARLRSLLSTDEDVVRVLGCGVSGWNLEQMMIRFDRDLARLDPAVVIINVFVDDLSAPYVIEDRSFSSWLRGRSALFRTIELSSLWPGQGNRTLPGWARNNAEYAAETLEGFKEWLQRHQEAGVEFVVVTHPMLSRAEEDPAGPLAQIGVVVGPMPAALVRMRPIYEAGVDGDLLSLSIHPETGDPHPTAAGHELVARHVAAAIGSLGAAGVRGTEEALASIGPRRLPPRICALVGDDDASAGVRRAVGAGSLQATWELTADVDALRACLGEGAGAVLVAGPEQDQEMILRDSSFRTVVLGVATPTAAPKAGWPENVVAAVAPPEDIARTLLEATKSKLGKTLVLHQGGRLGESIVAVLSAAGVDATARALDRGAPKTWADAVASSQAQDVLVLGPPACTSAVAGVLEDRRGWFGEWATQPEVLNAAAAAGSVEQISWLNRMPPTPHFVKTAGLTSDDAQPTAFAAGEAIASMLDAAVGSSGGSLEDLLTRLEAPEPGSSPFGGRGIETAGGLRHLADARFGVLRAVRSDGGWTFGAPIRP